MRVSTVASLAPQMAILPLASTATVPHFAIMVHACAIEGEETESVDEVVLVASGQSLTAYRPSRYAAYLGYPRLEAYRGCFISRALPDMRALHRAMCSGSSICSRSCSSQMA